MLNKLEKQLVSSEHQRALATMASPAISSNWQCLLLKILLYIYSTLHSKQVSFLTLGKLLEFHQFSKMVTKPKSLIIGQYRCYLLSFRLFEKLVFNQLYQYLNDNRFINSNESGFRELHSTVTCLLKNTDDWYNGLDTGNLAGMVFVDLKKAFDTVDHQILCGKLESYGVLHRELAWFGSYLSNRAQYCRVNGVDSQIENINIGVPQGSCLGPLLFLVYINDLPRAIKIPPLPCMLMTRVCAFNPRIYPG